MTAETKQIPPAESYRVQPTRWGVVFTVFITLVVMIMVLVAILGGAVVGYFGSKHLFATSSQTQITGAIGQIQKMGDLVSLKVPASQIVQHTESYKLLEGSAMEMSLRSSKVVLFAYGECLIGCDLRSAKAEKIDEAKKTFTLVLKSPRIVSVAISHEKSELFQITSSGLERLVPNSEMQKKAVEMSYLQAERQMRTYAQSPDMMETARDNAERVIKNFLQLIGWQATIRWE